MRQISLDEWDRQYESLQRAGARRPGYVGPLGRHVQDGDRGLVRLRFDNSPAALRLWNFLLTEEDRLRQARTEGKKIVGAMKDLGTVPVMAYSLDNVVAFYPDGAWWIPCVMELSAGLLGIADSLGIDESFCPVRAMLGAFVTEAHFPIPDLLSCSVGATCDDFSAIAQRLNGLGYPIFWWEIPHRRSPEPGETAIELPGGFVAPQSQIEFVKSELQRVAAALEELAGQSLDEAKLAVGIERANQVRDCLAELRLLAFTAEVCPIPALEMLIAEMLTIHFCSDQNESLAVLQELLEEVKSRVAAGVGLLGPDAARIFWVNPVADLQVMNLLEECGARICGTEYLFSHALDKIPEDVPPLEALAQTALADPMVGSAADRARRICADIRRFGAEAVLVSRIPGASHCALEGEVIRQVVADELDIAVLEIEVPPLTDSMCPALMTRLQALVETVRERRKK
ncbi:MAG: 2-hydroxyacyl-CoA dehydratase [Phycisphaerales bacterium]|nr:MAG: 2-hydroxyacyl-CoA dehydratase [Phycisphaerales bacterium]